MEIVEESFNPRTRESATNVRPEEIKTCIVSIHALVRVRLHFFKALCIAHGFNPRTRESETLRIPNNKGPIQVSIHALVRVRRESGAKISVMRGFNPRTRESATGQRQIRQDPFACFNPRTRESATGYSRGGRLPLHVSIHALVRVRPH